MGRKLKSLWRFYQRYIRALSQAEAVCVLEEALEISHADFMKLAARFGADHGRLPDNLHAAALLTGGDFCKQYIENLSGKMDKTGGQYDGRDPE